jgi:hypothetical protein
VVGECWRATVGERVCRFPGSSVVVVVKPAKEEGTMQYMLLICGEEAAPVWPADETMETDTINWVEEMDGRGVRKQG